MSTSVILDGVEDVLGREVMFIPEVEGPIVAQAIGILRSGDIGLLENTRFWPARDNDPAFARSIAANGDLYVNDAFSAAHRAHASTEGSRALAAGPMPAARCKAELEALDKALGNPGSRSRRWSAGPRSRPSSRCSSIW